MKDIHASPIAKALGHQDVRTEYVANTSLITPDKIGKIKKLFRSHEDIYERMLKKANKLARRAKRANKETAP